MAAFAEDPTQEGRGMESGDGGPGPGVLDQPAGARARGLKNDTLSFFDLRMETAARVGLRSSANRPRSCQSLPRRMGRCVSPAAWWIASLLLPDAA